MKKNNTKARRYIIQAKLIKKKAAARRGAVKRQIPGNKRPGPKK